jgi:hypothetical protein
LSSAKGDFFHESFTVDFVSSFHTELTARKEERERKKWKSVTGTLSKIMLRLIAACSSKLFQSYPETSDSKLSILS